MNKEDLEFYRNESLKGSDIEDLVDEEEYLQNLVDLKNTKLKTKDAEIERLKLQAFCTFKKTHPLYTGKYEDYLKLRGELDG